MAGLNKQEKIIKKYLDEESKKDGALKAVYKPEYIHNCFCFIREKAKKEAVNGCAMIEDTKVFKWARDYYYDEKPKEGSNTEYKEDLEEEVTEAYEAAITNKTKKKESKKEELEFVGSLF